MNTNNKVLWMGNIQFWMDVSYISSLLNSFDVYPISINIKSNKSKRCCAFLEFASHDEAYKTLKSLNGKQTEHMKFIFNWVKTGDQKSTDKIQKYTVSDRLM